MELNGRWIAASRLSSYLSNTTRNCLLLQWLQGSVSARCRTPEAVTAAGPLPAPEPLPVSYLHHHATIDSVAVGRIAVTDVEGER